MKKSRKILASLVAVACLLTQLVSVPAFADGVDYSTYVDSAKIAEAKADLGTERDITHGYAAGTDVIIKAYDGIGYGNSGNFYPSGAATEGYDNNVFDGDVASAADVNVRDTNDKQFYFLDADLNYKVGVYVDITINLRFASEIDRIFIAQRSDACFHANDYAIFISESADNLYDESNKKFSYVYAGGQYQVFDFDEATAARYVGIRIYKGVSTPYNYGAASSYPRFSEIAVFGEITDPAYQYSQAIDPAEIAACKEALATDYNLLQSGYVVGKVDKPSYIMINGTKQGVKSTEFGSAYSYDYGTANDGLFDGSLKSYADVNISGMVYIDNEGNPLPDTYADISICLMKPATVDKVFVANRSNGVLMTYKYAVFTSNSLSTLYNEENKMYEYENTFSAQYQSIPVNGTEMVKYVGIRIYEPVPTPFTAYGPDSAYPRLEDIAVFGKYDTDYFDYSVSANIDGVISKSDTTYSGREKTFSVPLVVGDKVFKEWQVNGTSVDCKINNFKNTATLDLVVDKNLSAEAIYQDLPTEIMGGKYGIDKENSKIRIPANELFYTVSTSLDVYRDLIVGSKGETVLNDKDYITAGAQIGIKDNADSCLTVVTAGDYDLNGTVEVTDIVSAIDGIFSSEHTADSTFAFDANNSGRITVSDVVAARKSILNTKQYNYSKQTKAIADMEYKTMGRTVIDTDGSLYFDLTASGLSFNTYCYGNIETTFSASSAEWITVIVDGKENMQKLKSGTQTVTIAEELTAGKHTIEIYKQMEGDHSLNLHSVTLNGEIVEAPKNAELLIEFAGDSITCGYGNIVDSTVVSSARVTDGYKSYGAQTARLLGADWSNVSKSGAALVYKEGMPNDHIPTIYKQQSYQKTDVYAFDRTADIVVINLGTNDAGVLSGMSEEQMKEYFRDAARDFVDYILENNGADTKIVFAFGMMTAPNHFDEVYIDLAAELQEEGTDAFYCRLPTNREGAVDHPNVAGDLAAAEVLSEFIKTNVLG